MTKKAEDTTPKETSKNKEEVKKEESVKETKKEVKKEPKTNPTKKTKNPSSNRLKTLVELVQESELDRFSTILSLSKTGYLTQFYEEEDKQREGIVIAPTLTEKEFEKIIRGE